MRRPFSPTDALTPLAAFVLALATPGVSTAQVDDCANQRPWSSIGVATFHCPGGRCSFDPGDRAEEAAFELTTEPWLRAIDPAGPAAGVLHEGDVLVAVDDLLVTSSSGGRHLARLPLSSNVRLTIRRGDRLTDVEVRPHAQCREPFILSGNVILDLPPSGEVQASLRRVPDGDLLIDLTREFRPGGRRGPTAVDDGLGLSLRCPNCEFSAETPARLMIPDYPVVETVTPGGVAEEAGLTPGDVMYSLDGHDLLSQPGVVLLLAPPNRDFNVEFLRNGKEMTARMNRRITVVRVKTRTSRSSGFWLRVRRTSGAWGSALLGAISRWWPQIWSDLGAAADSPIIEGDESALGGDQPLDWVTSGDHWGPAALGVLLRSRAGILDLPEMTLRRGEFRVRLEQRPIVAGLITGGPAADAGLRVGDVIVEVDEYDVREPSGSIRLLRPQAGRPLELSYLRDGRRRTTTVMPRND